MSKTLKQWFQVASQYTNGFCWSIVIHDDGYNQQTFCWSIVVCDDSYIQQRELTFSNHLRITLTQTEWGTDQMETDGKPYLTLTNWRPWSTFEHGHKITATPWVVCHQQMWGKMLHHVSAPWPPKGDVFEVQSRYIKTNTSWLSLPRIIHFHWLSGGLCRIRIGWEWSKSKTYVTRSDSRHWHHSLFPQQLIVPVVAILYSKVDRSLQTVSDMTTFNI